MGCNFKTLKPGNLLGKRFFCSFRPPTSPGWGTFYQHYTRTYPRNSRPSSLPSFLGLVSRMGHKMSGLGASPFQPSPPPTSPSISLPQPLGFEAFEILFHVCPGLPFISVGPDRDFGKAQRTIMRLSCPRAPGHGWMGPFLPHFPPTHNSFPGLCFILPCLTFTKGHALSVCPRFLPCFLVSPRLYPSPPETQSRAGQCYWCFFTSGPSSIFVFDMSPLPDTSFSPSLDPRA